MDKDHLRDWQVFCVSPSSKTRQKRYRVERQEREYCDNCRPFEEDACEEHWIEMTSDEEREEEEERKRLLRFRDTSIVQDPNGIKRLNLLLDEMKTQAYTSLPCFLCAAKPKDDAKVELPIQCVLCERRFHFCKNERVEDRDKVIQTSHGRTICVYCIQKSLDKVQGRWTAILDSLKASFEEDKIEKLEALLKKFQNNLLFPDS